MKKVLFIVQLVFLVMAPNGLSALNPTASVNWRTMTIDMGDVAFNKPVVAEFDFSNTGMIPMIISDVKPSCGCTVADFPKQPILSGQKAKVVVTFDAKTPGYFSKTITVHANVEGGIAQLYIKGTVIK